LSEYKMQREFVVQRLRDSIEFVHKLNAKLETRASIITAGSAALVGIVSAAEFLPKTQSTSTLESTCLGVVVLCTVIMFFFASKVWSPSDKVIPGTTDVQKLYEKFLSQDETVATNNAIIDLAASLEKMRDVNNQKSESVEAMIMIVQVQFMALGVVVLGSVAVKIWHALSN
jgi:hypothetical protein